MTKNVLMKAIHSRKESSSDSNEKMSSDGLTERSWECEFDDNVDEEVESVNNLVETKTDDSEDFSTNSK